MSLARVGLVQLADLFRRYARQAKPERRHNPVAPGFQARSALIVIARRRAERRLH